MKIIVGLYKDKVKGIIVGSYRNFLAPTPVLCIISVGGYNHRMGKAKRMLTPRQYAAEIGVAYTTVMNWLSKGLLPGAVKEQLPYGGGYYYQVPADTPKPELKSGPKPRASKKSSKK